MAKRVISNKFFFILSFLLILVISGCSPEVNVKKEKADLTEVKIATISGPSAMSMVKVIEEKPDLGEQVKAEYLIKDNPDLIKAMMLQKEVDIATIPTNLAAILYNKQGDYQAAAITVWGTLYLVGQDDSVKKWADLENKKVHVMGKGLTPEIAFRYLLKEKGIDPDKDLQLDYSFPMPKDLANATAAGKAKLALLSEPTASMVLDKNQNLKVIMDINQEWDDTFKETPMAQTCVVVRKDFAANHPDVVKAFLEKYKESTEWVNDNACAWSAGGLIVKHKILSDPKMAAVSIPRSNIKYKKADEIREGINKYLELLYNFDPKIVGGKLPDEGFYYQE